MDPAETFYIPTALALIADLLASATRLRPPRILAPEVASFKGGTSGVPGTTFGARKTPPSAHEPLISWESVPDVPLAGLSFRRSRL